MGRITMSRKEVDRIEILELIRQRKMTQKKGSEALKVSLRQVKRLCKRYNNIGAKGLVHLARGRPSGRTIKPETHGLVIKFIEQEEFRGFGPTLLSEILREEIGVRVSREWLRKEMIKGGGWKAKRSKTKKIHPRRRRRAREGELIQIDGSYEEWFEERGPRCCLLVFIDDATSKLMALRFVQHETTVDYLS